jgi:hypothetical protein
MQAMRNDLSERVNKLEQDRGRTNGPVKVKGHIREYSDFELAQLICAGTGYTAEEVLRMPDAEMTKLANREPPYDKPKPKA